MSRTVLPKGALILVCDSSKSLLFENVGDERDLNLKAIETHVEPHPPSRELGADRPTRVFDDWSRSAAEETDLHDQAEVAFLNGAAKALAALVHERGARHVAIVAPPRALGVLRDAIDAPTRSALVLELDKDWVKHPVAQIERHLAELRELK
ncbi:host attachment protein [Devosia sp.]|uniref:host attachment protein n=1 Tax=Devosia sp. TaxID=1871048 RepID=UPI001AC18697|nr:host attachment protein [Devosia sp.]MBN9311385.1 host attachment protein [Devosia sp.]